MKKTIAIILAFILVIGATFAGTFAWLTSTSSDVNTMTVGNVEIKNLEYERVTDEDGNWTTSSYTAYGYTADLMQPYTQDKLMVPAVGTPKWDDRNGSDAASGAGSHQQNWSQINAPGSNQLFDDSFKNVHDKFVFVENTGSVDAYYRTWIAVEAPAGTEIGDESGIMLNINANSRFDWEEELDHVEIDGVRYYLLVATYNEVLTPDEISRPSLLQLYMQQEITSEQAALYGEKVDVLVFSEAVQADGFEDAAAALDSAFGAITADNNPWNR